VSASHTHTHTHTHKHTHTHTHTHIHTCTHTHTHAHTRTNTRQKRLTKKPEKCITPQTQRRYTHTCEFSFSVRIWHMYLISKCRGKSEQGLRIASVLAEKMRPHNADFRFKNVFGRRICRKSALCSRILFPSTEVMCRPCSDFPLHFDIKNIYQIRTEKENAGLIQVVYGSHSRLAADLTLDKHLFPLPFS